MEEKKKGSPPLFKVHHRIDNDNYINASVWQTKSNDGKYTFNKVSLEKSYKKDGKWNQAKKFQVDSRDLDHLKETLNELEKKMAAEKNGKTATEAAE